MYRILFFLTIAVLIYTRLVWASQSLEHFSNKVQLKNSGWPVALRWLDSNLKNISINSPLYVQQNDSATYYLDAYLTSNGNISPVVAELQVINSSTSGFESYINLSPNLCHFTSYNNLCSIYIKDLGIIVGDKVQEVYYEAVDGFSFHSEYKYITIINNGLPGSIIEGVGPDSKANILTAIAVSDEPKQDNVPLQLEVKGANNLQEIHLEFEIESAETADFEGKKTDSCDIKFTGNEPLVCDKLIQVTPYAVGKTKINFLLNKSYWVHKGSNVKNYYTAIKPIQVNVGTLFAGYDNARVYRKGLTPYTIERFKDSPIRSIAIDQPSHKLYVLLPEYTYKQNNITTKPFALDTLCEIPTKDGRTLGLTNAPNRIIVGADDNTLYKCVDGSPIKRSLLSNMPGSILKSAIDQKTNITYFIDNQKYLGIYYTNFNTYNRDKFETLNNVIDLPNYGNMLVAANNNVVYAAVSKTAEAATTEPLSKLFVWVNEKMLEVKITGENPFMATSYISMLVFHHDHLYAGTSDGKLYYLNRENAQFKWQLVASTNGEIIDSAIDMNGNIYLANKQNGVWKVPFNTNGNINPAYKILNYSQDENSLALTVNTIAIDNNL